MSHHDFGIDNETWAGDTPDDEPLCHVCGGLMEWVECYAVDCEDGYYHDCGEDCCACADPELDPPLSGLPRTGGLAGVYPAAAHGRADGRVQKAGSGLTAPPGPRLRSRLPAATRLASGTTVSNILVSQTEVIREMGRDKFFDDVTHGAARSGGADVQRTADTLRGVKRNADTLSHNGHGSGKPPSVQPARVANTMIGTPLKQVNGYEQDSEYSLLTYTACRGYNARVVVAAHSPGWSGRWAGHDAEGGNMASTTRESVARFDVRASVCDDRGGLDGAYGLIGDGLTAEDVLSRIREALEQGGNWVSGETQGHVYLAINIGLAGSGEELPL